MAIHDDNWTKEMPTYYPQSTGDRLMHGAMAIAILLVVAATVIPSLAAYVAPLFMIIGAIAGGVAFVYFTYVAVSGRLPSPAARGRAPSPTPLNEHEAWAAPLDDGAAAAALERIAVKSRALPAPSSRPPKF